MGFPHELARCYGFEPAPVDPIAAMLAHGPSTLGDEASTLGAIDFSELMKHPEFSQAWAPVEAQLLAEGNKLDSLAVLDAQSKMADAFNQMTTSLGLADPKQIAGVAKSAGEFVMGVKTVAGALGTVQSLVNHATTGINDLRGAAQFTGGMIGTLVSTATALGAVSAGVGAAIMAVVGIVITAAEALFGDTVPQGTEICKGFFCNGAAFVIAGPSSQLPACCCVFAPSPVSGIAAIGPGSPGWRPFPRAIDPLDTVWYQIPTGNPGGGYPGTWRGADFEVPFERRPIDAAFPVYPQIECDEAFPFGRMNPLPWALGDFNKFWIAAWRANAAYALNGLKPQPDSIVLLHALRTWNASHLPGKPYVLVPQAGDLRAGMYWSPIGGGTGGGFTPKGGVINWPCPSGPFVTYMQMVAQDALNASAQFDRTPDNKGLLINTGDAIVVPSPTSPTPTAPAPSTVPAGVKLLLGSGLLATGGWLALGRPALTTSAIRAAARRTFLGRR